MTDEVRCRNLNESRDISWDKDKLYFGTVRWFNRNRGYGFIVTNELSSDEEIDVYVHYLGIVSPYKYKSLTIGENVYFNITEDEHGIKAVNVKSAEMVDGEEQA